MPQRQQVVDNREAARVKLIGLIQKYRLALHATTESRLSCAGRRPFAFAVVQIVNAANIHQHFKAELGFVTQSGGDRRQVFLVNLDRQLAA